MPVLRHINPYGACDVPLLRREGRPFGEHGEGCLEAGEKFDCTDEQARVLLLQAANFEPVDDAAKAIRAELDAEADVEDEAAGASEPSRPTTSSSKAEWVAYAEALGDGDAAGKTKSDLIAEHGTDPEV